MADTTTSDIQGKPYFSLAMKKIVNGGAQAGSASDSVSEAVSSLTDTSILSAHIGSSPITITNTVMEEITQTPVEKSGSSTTAT